MPATRIIRGNPLWTKSFQAVVCQFCGVACKSPIDPAWESNWIMTAWLKAENGTIVVLIANAMMKPKCADGSTRLGHASFPAGEAERRIYPAGCQGAHVLPGEGKRGRFLVLCLFCSMVCAELTILRTD